MQLLLISRLGRKTHQGPGAKAVFCFVFDIRNSDSVNVSPFFRFFYSAYLEKGGFEHPDSDTFRWSLLYFIESCREKKNRPIELSESGYTIEVWDPTFAPTDF